MTRVILQVFGTNGAGKSTLLRALAGDRRWLVCRRPPLTMGQGQQIVLVGDYVREKSGGVDVLPTRSKAAALAALDTALTRAPIGWPVAWEGIMIMTRQYHVELAQRGHPLYVILDPGDHVCVERVQQRGAISADYKKISARGNYARSTCNWLWEQGATVLSLSDHSVAVSVKMTRQLIHHVMEALT
jgi:hypothetical protein